MRARVHSVVFDVPAPTIEDYGRGTRAVAAVYAELLGLEVTTRADMYRSQGWPADDGDALDHMVLDDAGPNIAFEPVHGDYSPVRWPDPDHPAQIHVDVAVTDLDDAAGRVADLGATLLLDAGDHRVFADSVGHPFCLVGGGEPGGPGRMRRVVFDCFSPRSLAAFYRGLTGMEAAADSPEWVELVAPEGGAPGLGFRHVAHVAPRWPDPTRPQQVHVDWGFEGGAEAAGDEALRLGAVRLPYLGGGFVYADPAGHPFCLGE